MSINTEKTNLELIPINRKNLFNYLLKASAPVMEAELIKNFTDLEKIPTGRVELYKFHFSMYHALHNLRQDAGKNGYYLHLDPMRIRLVHLPEKGKCHHYEPEKGNFCEVKTEHDNFCIYHYKLYKDNLDMLKYDPLHEFYLNEENISFGTEKILDKLMNGIICYSLKKGAVENAKKFFKLEYPSKKTVIKRYHELAKSYHPDKQNGNDNLMKELNNNYQVLKEVYIL